MWLAKLDIELQRLNSLIVVETSAVDEPLVDNQQELCDPTKLTLDSSTHVLPKWPWFPNETQYT